MNFSVLSILKYGSVFALPLFTTINLFLICSTKSFSFSKMTLSRSIFLYNQGWQKSLFRVSFIIKALFDLAFWYYTINYFSVGIFSYISIFWLLSVICFGALCFFTEDKSVFSHYVVIYSSLFLFWIAKIAISKLVYNNNFYIFCISSTAFQVILTVTTLIKKTTNVYVQTIGIVFDYIWVLWMVRKFL
jgi:hypothetical protein